MATNGSQPLLVVEDLEKHFPITRGIVFQKEIGRVRAVDGISYSVSKGETLGVVGESGCGKSTMARCVMRLLEPTGGKITFDGRDITRLGRRELMEVRRDMMMVFQDPYASLNPRKRVGAIIGEALEVHKVGSASDIKTRVQELLEVVGLNPEHYNRFPHEFSGGQRQRIGVARALAFQPKLIICDEPVSALDVSIQAQVINLLADLQADFGLTYLFIAHDLSVVRHVSSSIAVMYLGKVTEIAPSDGLFTVPRHPYTAALLSAVPVPNPDESDQRQQIILAGDVPSPIAPPSGCRFHPRCPKAAPVCVDEDPPLEPRLGDGPEHPAACHLPMAEGENLADSRPSISAADRIVEVEGSLLPDDAEPVDTAGALPVRREGGKP
jgi:oligopeptide/dipeptide ABC transporter ATP-binding protein